MRRETVSFEKAFQWTKFLAFEGIPEKRDPEPWVHRTRLFGDRGPYQDPGIYQKLGPYQDPGP